MTQPIDPQPCCHDGNLTNQPVKVGEVHTASGAGCNLYACPEHAPLYLADRVEGTA